MIEMILGALWGILQGFIGLLLTPIDLAIAAALPDVDAAITNLIDAMQSFLGAAE